MRLTQLYFFFLLLIVSGCQSAAEEAGTDGGAQQPVSASEVAFRHADNVVRIGMSSEPPTLNPVLSASRTSRYVHEMIFQSLNAQDPNDYSLVPMLAGLPDVKPEANGMVGYAYSINPDATWPNGLPVSAADVVFSMKLVLNPLIGSGAYRSYYEAVSNVITSPNDERRFKVMTSGPYLLAKDAIGSLVIYPEYAYDPEKKMRTIRLQELATDRGAERLAKNNEDLQAFAETFNALETSRSPEDLIGSGPYRLEEWESGQRITLVKQDQYWAEGSSQPWLKAKPERLEFTIIQDANTMGTALRDELVDVVTDLPIEQFKDLPNDAFLRDRYDFEVIDGLKYFGILFNQQLPIFRDAATRRALAQLVDVDQLIEQLFPGGLASRVTGPVMPAKAYYNDALEPVDYDVSAAKAALSAAGWADSDGNGILDREVDGEQQELSFEFLIFPSPTSEAIGSLVAEWAAAAGVDIKVVPKDGRTLFGELDKGNFATAIVGQSFEPYPEDFTQTYASTSVPPNGTNRGGFADREVDQLLRKIRTTLDAEDRYPLYDRFQEIVYENQPMIFLFSTKDRLVVSRRFKYETRAKSPNLFFNALEQHKWNKPE
ncbi:ABC transporter substrate-binding protein [Lewinella sp. 4G2]|uniref:ABC transporter substrate-binding protein n=1 Tax=Lewinella sp. 4G2 TaxID=1803372 RepID=UPI0007B467FC|nr:ABC transporter substrate-binding protein [Lewinella sp. 4G2]OAV46065.1 hypothetical protein A3850_017530 [Lewinella sp. 4G2]